MTTVFNTKVAENKGSPRIWIEGEKLMKAGMEPGAQYDRTYKDNVIYLKPNPGAGKYVVSKKSGNIPVIDINSKVISTVVGDVGESVRVVLGKNVIKIMPHQVANDRKRREEKFKSDLITGKPLTVSSYFTGLGMLDKAVEDGFTRSGIQTKTELSVELEDSYFEAYLRNNPAFNLKQTAISGSVKDVNLRQIKESESSLVVCGIPCTGASLSGRSKGKLKFAEDHGGAGSLFFDTLQMIEAKNPAIVILENVGPYANTFSMDVIRTVMSHRGYRIEERILNGSEFGCLEERKRLCVVCVSEGLDFDFKLDDVTSDRVRPDKIADILEPIPADSPRWKEYKYLADKEKRDIAAGKGFRQQILTGEESKCGTIGRGYAKVRSTEPRILHPDDSSLTRIFTPVEHARLKCADPMLVDGLSETVAHQCLGQGIQPPAFEDVSLFIGESIIRWKATLTNSIAA